MEETIGLRMLAVGLVTMMVTVLLTMLLFYHVLDSQVQRDLKMMAQTAVHLIDEAEEAEIGGLLDTNGARLTLIDTNGSVLYESLPNAQPENHAERPEVIEAKKTGEGFAKRESATSGYDTYYYRTFDRERAGAAYCLGCTKLFLALSGGHSRGNFMLCAGFGAFYRGRSFSDKTHCEAH